MRILIITQYYFPEQFQINEIAPELVRRGHDVTILTGLPNYPKGELFPGYSVGEKIENGIRIIRVKEHPRKHDPINLFWNYLSYAHAASKKAKRLGKYDIVFCYQLSPVSILKPAFAYAKRNHVPILAYCLDIWPESAKAHIPMKFLYNAIASYSRKLYQACDHIAVTSRPFIDYLVDVNGIAREKLSYIPQHADSKMLNYNLESEDNGITDFMYAGNMGKGQTLDVIIRAAAEIKDKSFVVHMVGDGSQREELIKMAETLGLRGKVIFHGNQKREDMPKWYKKADALLITLRGDNAVGNTIPGKLQTYMTTGKPIIGAINGAANEVIKESNCGVCVSAGDYIGLAQLMEDYIDQPAKYSSCGENGRLYFVGSFTLKKCVDSIEKQMAKMVEQE